MVFGRLQSQWSQRFDVFPHVPLTDLIEVERSEVDNEAAWRWYLSTTVDFTICERETRKPLASVEFDGIGGGLSRNGQYIPSRIPQDDPKRGIKLLQKIRWAERVSYPLVVVSYQEAPVLSNTDHLTILDGVIGAMLARYHERDVLDRVLEDLDLSQRTDAARDDLIMNAVSDAHVLSQLEFNPLYDAAERIKFELSDRARNAEVETSAVMFDPALPDAFEERFDAIARAERIGCRVTVRGCSREPISQLVWIRNVSCSGIPLLTLPQSIAEYLTIREALSVLDG